MKTILLVCFLLSIITSCSDKQSTKPNKVNEERAKNFIKILEVSKVSEWVNPMNIEFRELIIKGGRPIGHVNSVGASVIKESKIYKEVIVRLSVCFIIEKYHFRPKAYTLKARRYERSKAIDEEYSCVGSRIGQRIEESEFYHCFIYYDISLDELAEFRHYKIVRDKAEDMLLSLYHTKHIVKTFKGLYEGTMAKGKKAGGTMALDIRF